MVVSEVSHSFLLDKFKAYKALVENEISMKIKTLQSNNGGELVLRKFDDFLHEFGIQQQNGVTKQTNRTIVECVKNMICA